MLHRIVGLLPLVVLWLGAAMLPAAAQTSEPRIAFVVGNGAYAKAQLPNALNDAGLVAEALRTTGFEIIEGADLNQADFMRLFRDYLAKVEAAGPDAVAFVYFSGYGLEFEGENYLIAADARLERDGDIPLDTVRLSDLLRPLAGAPARSKVVVLDAARHLPFAIQSARLARGLAAIEPPPLMLVSYSAAPGTVAADGAGPYGAFATAIAEMIREPGVELDTVFTRIRTRTHQLTEGKQTPWHMSALGAPVMLVPPAAPDATAQASAPPPAPRMTARPPRPMRGIDVEEAYALAIEQDALPSYVEFVEAFPRHAYTPRIWAIIRARREALAWMRALELNTPSAYWTYLRRYPRGAYAFDAERRLQRLSAALAPPPSFAPVEFFDVPPPLADEPPDIVEFYPAGPPPPRLLIEPAPLLFVSLPPPPPRAGPRFLPAPTPLPLIPRVTPGTRQPFNATSARTPPSGLGVVAPPPSAAPRVSPPPGSVPTATAPTGTPPSGPQQAPGSARPVTPATATAPTGTPPSGSQQAPGSVRPVAPATATAPTGTPPSGPQQAPGSVRPVTPATATAPTGTPPSGPQQAPGSVRPVTPATATAPTGTPPSSPQQKLPPAGAVRSRPSPTAVAPTGTPPVDHNRRGPPPGAGVNRPPPAVVNRPPPPAAGGSPPPPPAARVAPPPPAARVAPPPPPVARPAPPPHPVVARPAPPPAAARVAPPPPAQAPPKPAAPAGQQAQKKCPVVDGKPVCKP